MSVDERDDQRQFRRYECNAQSRALAGRLLLPGKLIDLSQGGYLFRPACAASLLPDTKVVADLCGFQLAGALVTRTPKGLHVRFPQLLTGKEVAEILLVLAAAGHVRINGVGQEEAKRLVRTAR